SATTCRRKPRRSRSSSSLRTNVSERRGKPFTKTTRSAPRRGALVGFARLKASNTAKIQALARVPAFPRLVDATVVRVSSRGVPSVTDGFVTRSNPPARGTYGDTLPTSGRAKTGVRLAKCEGSSTREDAKGENASRASSLEA